MNKNKGFTILYAVIVSTVVLIVGISLMNIISKQLIISTITKNSKISFMSAITGKECVDYWVLGGRNRLNSADNTNSPRTIVCAKSNITLNALNSISDDSLVVGDYGFKVVSAPSGGDFTQFSKFAVSVGDGGCVVAYTKIKNFGQDMNYYHITGFNVPCDEIDSNNPRMVKTEFVIKTSN